MTFIKYNPFRENIAYKNRCGRSYYDSPDVAANCFSPKIDMVEKDNQIFFEAEIPGVNKNDIKITMQDNILTIEGEKKNPKQEDNKKYYRSERVFGSFKRSFKLMKNIDRDSIEAKYEEGILNITLSKEEPKNAEERDISVN